MSDRSVGAGMNLLFWGYAVTLALGILNLLGVDGTLVDLINLGCLIAVMVALNRLKTYHPGYGKASGYEIALIVFSLLSGILVAVLVLLPVLMWLFTPVVLLVTVGSNILGYLVIRHTCLSTADLVGDTGDLATAALGAMVNKLYLVCCGVSVVCIVLSIIPLLGIIFNLLGRLASLASVVGLGLMVYFLYRARTCFNG